MQEAKRTEEKTFAIMKVNILIQLHEEMWKNEQI